MATSKANVIPLYKNLEIVTAQTVFERLEPIVDSLLEKTQHVHAEVGAAYGALPDPEKKPFRAMCKAKWKWSGGYVKQLAQIGREFPHKAELFTKGSIDTIPDFGIAQKRSIVLIPDAVLTSAIDEGMFDSPVTLAQVETLRKTGKVPKPQKPKQPKTDADKLMAQIQAATKKMDDAALSINKATAMMYETGTHTPKGKDVTKFVRSFEKLCASVATTIPERTERAFAILRGDV